MSESTFDRRRALKSAGALAAFGGLMAAPTAQAARRTAGGSLVADVALMGQTMAVDTTAVLPTGGLQGASFFVEGRIFPAGTLPDGASNFNPLSPGAIGIWLCRGWFINTSAREMPMVVSTQEFVFGMFSPSNAAIADQLVSSGLEGGPVDTIRSIIGGTGRYSHARGDVFQAVIGTNATNYNAPLGVPAPNLRFSFTFQ
jgi:hypothetical protein